MILPSLGAAATWNVNQLIGAIRPGSDILERGGQRRGHSQSYARRVKVPARLLKLLVWSTDRRALRPQHRLQTLKQDKKLQEMMLNLIDWLAPVLAVTTCALVPLFMVGWSIYALIELGQGFLALVKTILSLLVWIALSNVMFYVYLLVTVHGGATLNHGVVERTLKGNTVLLSSALVYLAIGCGLAVWVRGKPRPGIASARTGDSQRSSSSGGVNRSQ